MPYRIRIHSEAKWDFRRLPGHVRQRFMRLVDGLASNPTPADAKALENRPPGFYRIRVDRFRLVYRIVGDVVWILRAGLKGGPEFYEDLPEV